MIGDIIGWLSDPAHWSGPDGVARRTLEHLWYSAVALLVTAVIAIPIGLVIGHTGRGRVVVVNLAGAARAIPSLGLLFLLTLFFGARLTGDAAFLVPSLIALVVLAIPPVLAGAYAGVESVDPAARDAAKGMGMTGSAVLLRVELPCALPLVFSGLRSAALQIVATATIAAIVGLGGLGRFLIDGLRTRDFPQMAAGALVVAVVALLVDLAFAIVQRYAVSPGLTGRRTGRRAGPGRGGFGRITPSRNQSRVPDEQARMDPSRLTDQGAGT
ncbi:MAG TPA: ABC transporter permease [Pedococcus sp.]|uniref:ABC transporter permease n=1 Tax=Pedococcus sp. TaxID=2860345 RepID=UPI002F95B6A4